MISKNVLLCLGLALLAVGAAASGDHVVNLTEGDFDEKVGDGKVYFIKFFAPWCGHCKKMAPTWAELGSGLTDKDDVVIASVDCTQHRPVCDKAGIKGFPTLKVYQGGEAKEQYKGARTLDDLKTFITSQHKLLLEETTA